jgi:hypothetical protein
VYDTPLTADTALTEFFGVRHHHASSTDGGLGEIAERRKAHILQLISIEFSDPALQRGSQPTKLQTSLRQIRQNL